ncbi:hypothetical protein ACIBSV_31040 [Embleya sp. NPDC050154]|uniref:hypothetical protein n=1 Tax=Embleya sp. NPDC050154 TaxID=3363988 RepID=UPI003790D41C
MRDNGRPVLGSEPFQGPPARAIRRDDGSYDVDRPDPVADAYTLARPAVNGGGETIEQHMDIASSTLPKGVDAKDAARYAVLVTDTDD